MKAVLVVLGALLLIVLLIGGPLMSGRNELVTQREAVNGAWAQVDVDLQRRADLIPNLVETVKGFAKQEKEVLESIANARAGMLNARNPQERIQANQQMDSALGRLLVITENYPQLKSNENFLRLQDELAGTENRIAQSRRRYNDSVTKYNTEIEKFPNNLTAGLFGFQRNDAYFRTDPAKRENPQVKF
ncbi:MAG: LemA family protein [Bryobacteraceae bacterium]|nr:LemA family protein [Bryobacteraceae bacterium]